MVSGCAFLSKLKEIILTAMMSVVGDGGGGVTKWQGVQSEEEECIQPKGRCAERCPVGGKAFVLQVIQSKTLEAVVGAPGVILLAFWSQ